jgi:hypothetical protein
LLATPPAVTERAIFEPMRALDTSERAARIQVELNRALGPERRLEMVMELSEFARQFALTRLRAQHPELSEPDLRRLLTEQLYGRAFGAK